MFGNPISAIQHRAENPQAALREWLITQAAPLWLEHGVDRARGGYFDQLHHRDASNGCDFKRLRVTCRQIFVFAITGFPFCLARCATLKAALCAALILTDGC